MKYDILTVSIYYWRLGMILEYVFSRNMLQMSCLNMERSNSLNSYAPVLAPDTASTGFCVLALTTKIAYCSFKYKILKENQKL